MHGHRIVSLTVLVALLATLPLGAGARDRPVEGQGLHPPRRDAARPEPATAPASTGWQVVGQFPTFGSYSLIPPTVPTMGSTASATLTMAAPTAVA